MRHLMDVAFNRPDVRKIRSGTHEVATYTSTCCETKGIIYLTNLCCVI